MWIIHILIFNLAVVFITELPLAFFMGAKTLRKFITATLINIITNPAAVLLSLYVSVFFPDFNPVATLILEVLVVMTEGALFSGFKTFRRKKPYIISLALNAASFLSGEVLNIFM